MVKPVLITGGTYGIGRAIAVLFQQGNNAALTWRHREPVTDPNDN
ncbi:hypothetical protein ACFP4H_03220 [Pseudophaeobacter arcticus]|nr:hypothetical protein [Pseudophaeobacter arcticus]